MNNNKSKNNAENVCNYTYLFAMTNGKEQAIKEITDVFLSQISEELKSINDAVTKSDYDDIKRFTHTMKTTVTIMGIAVLTPILQEMESLGASRNGIEKIAKLNKTLNRICRQAIDEIERDKFNFVLNNYNLMLK